MEEIFHQHNICLWTPSGNNWLIPRTKFVVFNSNVVYSIHCNNDCNEQYIGETKQPLQKKQKNVQHRRASSSGPESPFKGN